MKPGNPFSLLILLSAGLLFVSTSQALAEIRHQISDTSGGNPSLGDLDGDGDLDIFRGYPLVWFENDGNGSFSEHTLPNPGGASSQSAIVDIDGDGDLDLITCIAEYYEHNVYLYFWENNGSGLFTDRLFTYHNNRPQSSDFVVADFDNDGDADVFLTRSDSYIYDNYAIHPLYFENTGNWEFTDHHLDYEYAFGDISGVADFNDDNLLDVVVGGREGQWSPSSNYEIIIFENDGFPQFTERGINLDSLGTGFGIDTGDFNSDGRLDIVYSGGIPGMYHTYAFESTNTNWEFTTHAIYDIGYGSISACDYNVDGFLDVAMGSGYDPDWNIVILFSDGNGNFPTIKDDFMNYDAASTGIVTGDMDGDGDPDIVDRFVETDNELTLGWWENETINPFITVTLEPHNAPIVIPANGGTISFSATVENRLLQPQSCTASGRIRLPGGAVQTLWYQRLTLNPGETIEVTNLQQIVPAQAPAGVYSCYIVLGWLNLPTSPRYRGSFTFVKQP